MTFIEIMYVIVAILYAIKCVKQTRIDSISELCFACFAFLIIAITMPICLFVETFVD